MPSNRPSLFWEGKERNLFSSIHHILQDSHPCFIFNHNPPTSVPLESWESPMRKRPALYPVPSALPDVHRWWGQEKAMFCNWGLVPICQYSLLVSQPKSRHVKNVPVLALKSLIVSFLLFPLEPHLSFGCRYNQCLWKKKKSRRD